MLLSYAKCMAYGEVRRHKVEKEKAAKEQILDNITTTVIATTELIRFQEEVAEAERRNKEEEERRQMEIEEKEKADRVATEEELLDDITTTVIASAVLEAIRMEEGIRKEQEVVELAAALLEEEEEAKAADEARRKAAETGLLDIPIVVSAEHSEATTVGTSTVFIIPFLPTIIRLEQSSSAQATSSVVDKLIGFMTQVVVTVEKNVNIVMNALEERKQKEVYYDSSLETLFDLVQKGEEDRRKEREEKRRMECERLAREEEREERRKLEEERLAREVEEEVKRQQQFVEMLRIAMQGRICRN